MEGAVYSLVPLVLLAVAAFVVWSWFRKRRVDESGKLPTAVQRLVDETQQTFEEINAAGGFAPVPAGKLVSTEAKPLLAVVKATMHEVRTVRTSTHVGTRIKVAGAPIYLGQSVPRSETKLSEVAAGDLGLTPEALVFSGDRKSATLALSKITAVEALRDAITLTVEGRQKPVTFSLPNGLLWAQLVRNVMAVPMNGRKLPEGHTFTLR